MKKFFGWFFGIIVIFYAARHPIVATVLELILEKQTGEAVSYENRTWEGGKLIYTNFSLGNHFKSEKFTVEFHFLALPLSLHVALDHPTIEVSDDGSRINPAFLLPTRFWIVKLNADAGSLETPERNYSFHFVSGFQPHEIGKLSVDRFLNCDFSLQQDQIAVRLQIERGLLPEILPLASLFYTVPSFSSVEGIVSAHLEGGMDALWGDIALADFKWESETVICGADSIQSSIDFDHQLQAFDLNYQGFDFFWKEIEVRRGEGFLQFKQGEIPTFGANGRMNLAHIEGQVELDGKGELHPDKTLWMEGSLEYKTHSSTPLQVNFSLADDGTQQVLQTELKHVSQEILALIPKLKIKQGSVEATLTTFFQNWTGKKVQMEEFKGHAIEGDSFALPSLQASGTFNLENNRIDQLVVQIHQGKYLFAEEIDAHIEMIDHCFASTHGFGKVRGIPTEVEVQGPLSSFQATWTSSAGASAWLEQSETPLEPPAILELAIHRNQEMVDVVGTFSCLEDTVSIQSQGHLFTGRWNGSFESSRIKSSFYEPFIKILAPDFHLSGDLSVKGNFTDRLLDVKVQGENIGCKHRDFEASVPNLSPEFFYHFDFLEQKGHGQCHLSNLTLTTPRFPLQISVIGGDLFFDQTSLSCRQLQTEVSSVRIDGDLHAHFGDKPEVDFIAQKVEGSLKDLSQFQEIPNLGCLEGFFTCRPEGLQIYWEPETFHYRMKTFFHDIRGPLTPHLNLQNTGFCLHYDTLENQWIFENLKGSLVGGGEEVSFASRRIGYHEGNWNFDGTFSKDGRSLCTFQGKAMENRGGYDFVFQEAHASGSYLKSPLTFHFRDKTVSDLKGVVYLESDSLYEQLTLLDQFGLAQMKQWLTQWLTKMQGGVTLKFIHNPDQSEFEIGSSQLTFGDRHFHHLQAHLFRHGNQWTVKNALCNDLQMQGKAVHEKEKWIFPTWDIAWKKINVHLVGVYDKDDLDFEIDGQYLSRFSFQGSGVFHVTPLQFDNLALQIQDGKEQLAALGCEKMKYGNDRWESSALNATLFSNYFEHPLKTKLVVSLGDSSTFQGKVSQGDAKVGSAVLKIVQIFGLYKAPYFNLKCLATLDDEPLQITAKFSDEAPFPGGIHIEHEKEIVKLAFSNPSTLHKIEGNLLGLHLQINRENQGYQGSISIQDSTKITEILDQKELKDLQGIRIEGKWNDGQFHGELEGNESCIKNYYVQKLRAHLDFTRDHFQLTQVAVNDPAGSLFIKECSVHRQNELWLLSVPVLKGQDIKPSLIRKKGVPPKENKPLQIRRLVMTDLAGTLGDLHSLTGVGTFHFTQRIKKEPSLFEIPLTFLKDLGLDLDLFTPVMGEVKLQLKEGKLYFTELQNAFSEGKRSEFYLADTPSFIDLNGDLFLQFRMQQNVVLKLAEPFTIAVRGTWEKPRYSLQ